SCESPGVAPRARRDRSWWRRGARRVRRALRARAASPRGTPRAAPAGAREAWRARSCVPRWGSAWRKCYSGQAVALGAPRTILPGEVPRVRMEGAIMKRPLQGVVVQGAVGGVLAGSIVALWFFVVDLLAGQPFHAPAALAAALFHQEAAQATVRLIASYTVLHFGAFALLGVAMAWAIAPLEAPPRTLLGVVFGFLALDLVAGHLFRTPGALGSTLFLGVTGPAQVQVSLGTVAGYTVVHLAAFAVAGVVLVAVAEQVERVPALLLVITLALIILE